MTAAARSDGLVPLIMLRHGPTDWNQQGRIQGRIDRPLSEQGRNQVSGWRLPSPWHDYRWVTSPLARARETAALLGHDDVAREVALIEMHWGAWEGWRLEDLRQQRDRDMVSNEARGLDFRPSGGESPRAVQDRLKPWLRRVAEAGEPTLAVCHKGVIRALYCLASGWDLTGEPPEKLRDATAHQFLLSADGSPAIERLNLSLTP